MISGGQLGARRWDQIAAGAGVIAGVLVAALGTRLDFGAWTNPGPGMMPVVLGATLAGLSLVLLAGSLARANREPAGPGPWASTRWRPVVTTLVVLLAYALLLDPLGYGAATFLLLAVLLRVIEPSGWGATLLWALLITAGSYGLFAKLLQIQLPRAAWGF